MPTWCRPPDAARSAVESALRRPFAFGYDTSTIVQPFWLRGQAKRPFLGPAGRVFDVVVGSGAVGRVDVLTVGAGGGLGTAVGSATLTGVEAVKTWPWDCRCSTVSAIAAAAPAAATRSVRSEIHTQSPGYQPNRRSQRRRSSGTLPSTFGSARPHSRQKRCPGSRGAPQRGQVPSAAAIARSRSSEPLAIRTRVPAR